MAHLQTDFYFYFAWNHWGKQGNIKNFVDFKEWVLERLEKDFNSKGDQFECFHFTSKDNPYLAVSELNAIEEEYKNDRQSYQQEILAEYIENAGSLFHFEALIDVFSNTIVKEKDKYLIVDIADDGTDKTKFSFWEGLEEYRREEFERLNTESIISKIREYIAQDKIPMSHVAVDAIGVGAGVASSSLLDGIIGYKSSYAPIKTDKDFVRLPNTGYTKIAPLISDYKNLRSQCVFTLADLVNNHKISSILTGRQKEEIIEELSNYQDASTGDGKRMATQKDIIKEAIGRSPDASDTWIMRMYFVIRNRVLPENSEQRQMVLEVQQNNFMRNRKGQTTNSNK